MIRVHFPALKSAPTVDFARAMLDRAPAATDPWGRRWNELNASARDYFQIVPADQAQIFFYPYQYELNEQTRQAASEAESRGVPCVFLDWGDDSVPRVVPSGLLYRHSLFSDQRVGNEFAAPAFADDPLRDGGESPLREKSAKARVGFCGYVGTLPQRIAYRLAGRKRKSEGLVIRARLLRALRRNKRVDTDFLPQNRFSGGAKGIMGSDPSRVNAVRARFLENILNTDYTLCVRGAGNFSYRFYEVLAAGRIPVFINTRCVLPFEDRIDWRRHCVWVEESEMDGVGNVLADFHESLSVAGFLEMQRANRRLWKEWLTPLSFYRQLMGGLVSAAAGSNGIARFSGQV